MGNEKKSSPLKWNESSLNKKEKFVFSNDFDDWEDPQTFVTALENVEAWIFSQIIESVGGRSIPSAFHLPPNLTFQIFLD
uniref:Uncharacterized protein n=1 Tax=Nelumbo nucifera TaxID=4432 RepID=A0A822Z689_NELNU|nr:TPA_asm: hypothetical protein HUJ06_014463 [Nelumbo nucifera]